MKDLSIYCEGLLDSDFGDNDDMLIGGLVEYFPNAKLTTLGKTIIAKYSSSETLLFTKDLVEMGFNELQIEAPRGTLIDIYYTNDRVLSDFTINAPDCMLRMSGTPATLNNVTIKARSIKFEKMREYKWAKVTIDVGEDGKILLELPYAAKHSMASSCRFECGLLGIAPLNAYDIIHKKLVKLGYSDVTLNSLLEPEEYLEKPLLKGLGINAKSWPNLKNIIIAMTDGKVANYGLEFFNRHRAATTWGRWKDDIAEFADGWEGGPSSDFHMVFYL